MTRIQPSRTGKKIVQERDPVAELSEMLPTFHIHMEDAAASGRLADELKPKVFAAFAAAKLDTIDVPMPGGASLTATISASSHQDLDDAMLLGKLTPTQRRKVTRQVVDQDLLAAEIQRGTIDPALVAQCTKKVPHNPSIRRTYHSGKS